MSYLNSARQKQQFLFDKVFAPSASLEDVFLGITLHDLLAGGREEHKHKIRDDTNDNRYVEGFTTANIGNIGDVSDLLEWAAGIRRVGKSEKNDAFSRSHMVVTLKINGKNDRTGEGKKGVLNLIDLASNEAEINTSLTTLGRIFCQLGNKKHSHVSYRVDAYLSSQVLFVRKFKGSNVCQCFTRSITFDTINKLIPLCLTSELMRDWNPTSSDHHHQANACLSRG
ncbi:unnamed protein product [Lactuca virosa]|uniref:Kinesin motor domain-containing protein n=1 Tax=Lactuca virosa TaxID=75947 RepID=A0AAU9MF82_9ASTR|nr:unnamed protein product [Lactuca virosa]